MKAKQKIDLLEKTVDYLLMCTMRVSKNDEEIARAFDICGVPQPGQDVIDALHASAKRIEGIV
jgi:hypothetical protein